MSGPYTNDSIANQIGSQLAAFCGVDAGRSIAFCSARTGLLHVKGEVLRPVASIIKVPLVMALYDLAAEGKSDLNKKVPAASFSKTRYASILAAFDDATQLSLREIASLALITSDNPLAIFITGLVGFERVNLLLRRLHCSAGACMAAGFTEEELGPKNRVNLASANDLILVFQELASNPRYADLEKALANNLRNNRIPALLPDSAVVAHKTGSLEGVVNDAGIVRDKELDFFLACLTDNQADVIATTTDIATCAKRIYELLSDAVVK